MMDLVDQIFDFQIRDFSSYAVALHGKPDLPRRRSRTGPVGAIAQTGRWMRERFGRVWERVKAYNRACGIRP